MSPAKTAAPHVLIAASVARRHLGRGRQHVTLIALRALPSGVRRAATRLPADWPLAALALAATGRRTDALAHLEKSRPTPAIIEAAVALDAHDLAATLLAAEAAVPKSTTPLEPQISPTLRYRAALAAARRGDLTEALTHAQPDTRLHRHLQADLNLLTPEAGRAGAARTGRASGGVKGLGRGGRSKPGRTGAGWAGRAPGGVKGLGRGARSKPGRAGAARTGRASGGVKGLGRGGRSGEQPQATGGGRRAAPAPGVRAGRVVPAHPRTVLHVTTNALPETVAGYTLRTHGIATAQHEAGLDVHVVTRLGFPATKGHLRAAATHNIDGVEYHRLLATLPKHADEALAKDVERTTRLVERLRPEVLHAHTNHLNGQVAVAVRERTGIPVVYEVRGFLEETRRSTDGLASETYRLAQAVETWCMEQADAVVTLSQTMADAIVARGIDPAKITVVPNGVPDSLLEGTPTAQLRGNGPFTAGFVGTLNDYEGVDVLIHAVAKADGVRLIVVGDGPARAALEKQAEGLPVTFTGRVPPDEVAKQYAAIDVFCLPRRDLPVTRLVQPLKPLEAMALGRPVIASDLPPLAEIVTERTGRLVPADDDTALAEALTDLAQQPAVRRELGAAARDWVATHRTWSRAAATYTDLYSRLAPAASRPDVLLLGVTDNAPSPTTSARRP